MARREKPITQNDKAKIVVDAIVVSHFIVGNMCILLGAFTDLFDPYKKGFKGNAGIDFLYSVLDAPIFFLFNKVLSFYYVILGLLQKSVTTLAAIQPGSFFYYLMAECIVLLGSAFYGLLAYMILRTVIKMSKD